MAETYNMSHSVEQSSFSRSDQGKAKAKGRHLKSFTVLNIDNQTVCPNQDLVTVQSHAEIWREEMVTIKADQSTWFPKLGPTIKWLNLGGCS